MRLTIINQFYKPDISATANLAASLAEHRAALGDRVTVITSQGGYVCGGDVQRVAASDNPRVCRLWTAKLGRATFVHRLVDYVAFYLGAVVRAVILRRQDMVVVMTTPPGIGWAGLLHKMLHRRTKLVLWNMDCYPDLAEATDQLSSRSVISRILRVVNRGLFGCLDHLVCLDHAMAEFLHRNYVKQDRQLATTVIPNWEPAALFPNGSRPPAWESKTQLGLDGHFVVLYLGNMGLGHEFDTLLSAAEALRTEPIRFLFVGHGARWNEVKQEAENRQLANIVMHNHVPKQQTPSVIAVADCAFITLRESCLGLASPSKLHSNLAMGVPVVYTGPVGSNVDEAIVRFHCGVSLRQGQVQEMVDFFKELMTDDARLTALKKAARYAFDQAYCDSRTLPIFDRVIDGLGRPL